MGLKLKDEKGFLLYGRSPFILAGRPPHWIRYDAAEEVNEEDIKELLARRPDGGNWYIAARNSDGR
jgi:hypothetical protein